MIRGTLRTLRYGRSWLTGRTRVEERTLELDRSDRTVPASLFLPPDPRPPLPAWVILHGITRTGRRHASLLRFVRALVATRAAVIVPEVPEWVALELAPGTTGPSVRASVDALRGAGVVDADAGVGLLGFSFGAPQGLIASTERDLAGDIAGVVGFGGYCDLERALRFQLTGRHEWRGTEHRLQPDPYGRWIIAGNFLTAVPGYEDAGDVAGALLSLAREAGDRGFKATNPIYDPSKAALKAALPRDRRELFDLFAPPSDREPDPERAGPWVQRLAEAGVAVEPRMDPRPWLDRVDRPVHLLHGRNDQLIPFTETLRLRESLPADVPTRATVTGLFSHSGGDDVGTWMERMREAAVFVSALSRVLTAV